MLENVFKQVPKLWLIKLLLSIKFGQSKMFISVYFFDLFF